MTGTEWIADKINSGEFPGIEALVQSENILFLRRSEKPDAYVGVISTKPKISSPIVGLDEVKDIRAQRPDLVMMIAIPRGARWSAPAMEWLQSESIAFGGVGDLLSAMNHDDDMSTHRNKTFSFVDEGLRRHSRVEKLEWIDSKKVNVRLRNDVAVTVALDDAYDITMTVAHEAASSFGKFDILLKTNPNGSITSNGAESVERLGFQTLKWGELFGYLAKRGR